MGAELPDPAVLDDDDQVGHSDGGEAVGHQDGDRSGRGGELLRGPAVLGVDRVLGLRVEGRRRFVEQHEQRTGSHEGPGEGQTLPLPAGEADTAGELGAQLGVEPAREDGDDRVGLAGGHGGLDPATLHLGGQVADTDRLGGQEPQRGVVLEPGRESLAPGVRVDVGERNAVDQNAPLGRVVQAAEQLHQGRLPGAVGTDEGDRGAGGQVQIDTVTGRSGSQRRTRSPRPRRVAAPDS